MTSDLTCPTCGGQLVPWAVGDVTVHGCQACGGVWFERDGIEAAASLPGEALRAIEHEFSAGLGTLEGDGCCPCCRTKLRETAWATAVEQTVATCQTCLGVWCEEGRLESMEAALPVERPRRDVEVFEAHPGLQAAEWVYCVYCGESVHADAMVCTHCGQLPHSRNVNRALSVHRLDPQVLLSDAIVFAAVLAGLSLTALDSLSFQWNERLYWLSDGGILTGCAVAAAMLLQYGLYRAVKWRRIEVCPDGLSMRSLLAWRQAPWSEMRRVVVIDRRVWPVFGLALLLVPAPIYFLERGIGTLAAVFVSGTLALMVHHVAAKMDAVYSMRHHPLTLIITTGLPLLVDADYTGQDELISAIGTRVGRRVISRRSRATRPTTTHPS